MTDRPASPSSRLRSGLLLVALLLLIVSEFKTPQTEYWGRLLGGLLQITVFSVAGFLIGARRRWLIGYVSIALPLVVVGLATTSLSDPPATWMIVRHSLKLGVQVLLVCLVLRFSLFQKEALRHDRVIAGICGYLILGLMWADFYSLHEVIRPGGLVTSAGTALEAGGGSRLYFSLVTLTTTGYGDILPAAPTARLLANFEALAGTLYLAVFIASLISGGDRERR